MDSYIFVISYILSRRIPLVDVLTDGNEFNELYNYYTSLII